MESTFNHRKALKNIVRRSRTYDSRIGRYRSHRLNQNDFIIQLNNGLLEVSFAQAQAQASVKGLTPDEIFGISKTFVEMVPEKQPGFLQRLAGFFGQETQPG